jgi:hypothetical protein
MTDESLAKNQEVVQEVHMNAQAGHSEGIIELLWLLHGQAPVTRLCEIWDLEGGVGFDQ